MRLLAYCLLPTHWHLVVWPYHDGGLSDFMRWLTVTHTKRWHARHHTSGTGPRYQGHFKSRPLLSALLFHGFNGQIETSSCRCVFGSGTWG
jgi:putative transposase